MPVIREKFPARVADNRDRLKRGRVRVTCSGLMGDDETLLPDWVEPAFKWGSFQVPDIGELIEIECNAQNDQEEDVRYQAFLENPNICWSGTRFESLEAGTPRPVNPLFQDKNYGKRRGFATPAGHVLLFDDTDGEQQITLTWRRGDDFTQMTMDKEGSIILLDRKGNMIHVNAKDGKEGITVADANNNMIALKASGITVKDDFDNFIELKDGVVTVSAGGAIDVAAATSATITVGDSVVDILSDGDVLVENKTLTLDADNATLIKGAAEAMVLGTTWGAGRTTMNAAVGAALQAAGLHWTPLVAITATLLTALPLAVTPAALAAALAPWFAAFGGTAAAAAAGAAAGSAAVNTFESGASSYLSTKAKVG